uniref:Integrase n=1 Tax=Solanum tuberosum TaxID=4113 RepID=M1DPQ5_SOLTU
MSPNDFGDSPFVYIITVSCLPSAPSRSGPLGGIVLLRGTIRRSVDCSFHRLFYPSPSGLRVLEERADQLSAQLKRATQVHPATNTLLAQLEIESRGRSPISPSLPSQRYVPSPARKNDPGGDGISNRIQSNNNHRRMSSTLRNHRKGSKPILLNPMPSSDAPNLREYVGIAE